MAFKLIQSSVNRLIFNCTYFFLLLQVLYILQADKSFQNYICKNNSENFFYGSHIFSQIIMHQIFFAFILAKKKHCKLNCKYMYYTYNVR